jgi:hypothetical protein
MLPTPCCAGKLALDLSYALKRVIRGLASNRFVFTSISHQFNLWNVCCRASARQGYAALLSALLACIPAINVCHVTEFMAEALKVHGDKGQQVCAIQQARVVFVSICVLCDGSSRMGRTVIP